MEIKFINFQEYGDSRGRLAVAEEGVNIPFAVRRVYYLYDTKSDVVRGLHAHKKLEQILVCVAGSCSIRLDDGSETTEVVLDNPDKGLYVGASVWREMFNFSDGAVLLVLASELYSDSDYIRDYNEFIEYKKLQTRIDEE